MDTIFCDITALRLHRMPPCVIELIEDELDRIAVPGRAVLREQTVLDVLLPKPIHLLRFDRASRFYCKTLHLHLWTGDPSGVFRGLTGLTDITTVPATLLQLARRLAFHETAMLVSEFLGTYSVMEMPESWWEAVPMYRDRRGMCLPEGWEVALAGSGKPTSLLKRPPLVTRAELVRFAETHQEARGFRKLLDVVRCVHEGAASPFESRAALLFGLPCTRGGAGYTGIKLNCHVDFDERARVISGLSYCIADILIESGDHAVVVECQSAMVHASGRAYLSDGKRATALQAMGYTVVLLTEDQLRNEKAFDRITSMIDAALGFRRLVPGKRVKEARKALRRILFQSWAEIGCN